MCRQDVKGKVRKGGPVMTMLYRATELAGVRRLGLEMVMGKPLGSSENTGTGVWSSGGRADQF